MNFKTLATLVVLMTFVFVNCDQKKTAKEYKSTKTDSNIENDETPDGMVWVS